MGPTVGVRLSGAWATALAVAILGAGRLAAAAGDPVSAILRLTADRAIVDVTIGSGYHINGPKPRDEFLIPTTLTLTPPTGITVGAIEYPATVERRLSFSPTPLLLYEDQISLSAPLTGGGTGPFKAALRFQACNDSTCLPPKTLELTAQSSSPPAAAHPRNITPSATTPDNQIASLIARWGTPVTLFWIFLGGIALNLTPCVYPLISITVSFFGGRTSTDSGRALGHALLYALGICATFSGLGVTAALTGSLFGAALQQPIVLGGIAALLVSLALSNFGLWQIRPPTMLMQIAGRAGDGAAGAFFMGLTMGIVAAPCIGPFALGLLLYVGAQQDVWLGFVMFLALGLGLGAPYVALAGAASQLRRLPRSGPWLTWIEHLFGVLLLGAALHFATPLLPAVAVRLGWTALLVGGGIWLGLVGTHGVPVLRALRAAAGAAAIVLGLTGWLRTDAGPAIAWVPYSDSAVSAATAAGRPVLIDFQAEWCIPCREMEHSTFRDPTVVAAAAEWTLLRADVTTQDDDATRLMARYRVIGVPTYVLLDRTGTEQRRLVGFVATPSFLDAMREAQRG